MSNSNLGNTGQPASADTPSAPSASSAPPASSAESAHDQIHEGSVTPREETSEPNGGPTSLSPESSELNEVSIAQSDESERDPKRTLTLSPARADAWETELRGRLGVVGRLPHTLAVQGWIAALIAGFIAFVTRFWNLAHPHALVFDETYYVKGAFSLLHQGFEGVWNGDNANDLFLQGNYSALSPVEGDYVVHPPLGKWLMAFGQMLFGENSGVGWRFTTAFLGVASVMLIVYIAMRLFRSPLLAGFAGIAMALDGMGITLSRTGILDNILAFFTLAAFATLLLDREDSRAKLAHRTAHGEFFENGKPRDPWGVSVWNRPWMLATGLLLGMACGVKWSGIYAIAVFGVVAFAWGVSARKTVGTKLWFGAGVFREGLPAFVWLVPIAFVTYLAAWIPWFANPNGYGRHWAQTANPQELPLSWAPDAINSLLHYHGSMWSFHNGLNTPHDYQSQAWQWLFQARPVSFFWEGTADLPSTCGESGCVQAITSVGNPSVWWLALIGLAIILWCAIGKRDWRAWAILSGYIGMWMPWMAYTGRTIFQFYAIAVLPFVVLALTYGLAYLTGTLARPHARRLAWEELEGIQEREDSVVVENGDDNDPLFARFSPTTELTAPQTPWWLPPNFDRTAYIALGVATALIVVAAIFWMPLWWGSTISHSYWSLHMWFQSWI